jgi:hypothetical protein
MVTCTGDNINAGKLANDCKVEEQPFWILIAKGA